MTDYAFQCQFCKKQPYMPYNVFACQHCGRCRSCGSTVLVPVEDDPLEEGRDDSWHEGNLAPIPLLTDEEKAPK